MPRPYLEPCRRLHGDRFATDHRAWSGSFLSPIEPVTVHVSHASTRRDITLVPGDVVEAMGRGIEPTMTRPWDWLYVRSGDHAGTCVEYAHELFDDEPTPGFAPVPDFDSLYPAVAHKPVLGTAERLRCWLCENEAIAISVNSPPYSHPACADDIDYGSGCATLAARDPATGLWRPTDETWSPWRPNDWSDHPFVFDW